MTQRIDWVAPRIEPHVLRSLSHGETVMTGVIADQLADGRDALAASRRICADSHRLAEQMYCTLLTYRSHRLLTFQGASDADGSLPFRRLLLALASDPAVKTFAGYSNRGGTCAGCGEVIKTKDVEYEIENTSLKMTIDIKCYMIFMQHTQAV